MSRWLRGCSEKPQERPRGHFGSKFKPDRCMTFTLLHATSFHSSMGDYIWYAKIYRNGSTKECKTPLKLLPTSEGHKIVWSKSGCPQGHWAYYDVQEGSDVSAEMCLCFSGSEEAPLKEHYCSRIPGTNCWSLLFAKGNHNHMEYDTVLLIKSEENRIKSEEDHDAT